MTDDHPHTAHDDGHGQSGGRRRRAGWKQFPPIVKVFLPVCAVLLLLDLVIHRHVAHSWEAMFGFYPVYGFVACVLLVLAATQLRKVVMRPEDYYDAD